MWFCKVTAAPSVADDLVKLDSVVGAVEALVAEIEIEQNKAVGVDLLVAE